MNERTDLLQGTLDLLILSSLRLEPMHGFGIAVRLRHKSDQLFQVEMGSLYPALCRLEARNWIKGEWGVSESNRKAKYYSLTKAGRKQLEHETTKWGLLSGTINTMLKQT